MQSDSHVQLYYRNLARLRHWVESGLLSELYLKIGA